MRTPLPSKDMVLSACAGTITLAHPILHAAEQLASLHEARDRSDAGVLDRERARLVSLIDDWVAAEKPPAFGAAYLHSETVGMIIDRLAQLSVDAREAAQGPISAPQLRDARLTELAHAYGDLAFEIARGTRRLPEFSHRPLPNPASQ